ncbi:signal peptidase II [Clostridiaceae bacterium 68-1-5]|uniref:Signal peptidase II n=1 Tax=Suipraeoptans intestinalis TaxID=2606628 RepID=A0A6N7UYP8_9FIRM|nr:signal peptidase II [Suipraeoptans intestinalis]MSR93465.1 signal peptidase II [Suipraeoptans intestinalis]
MWIGLFLFLTGTDLAVKQYVETQMEETEEIRLSRRLFFRKVHNRGFLLGKLEEFPGLIKGVSMLAAGMAGLFALQGIRKEKSRKAKAGLVLTLAGAASNLYDRLVRGYVVDYIGIEEVKGVPKGFTANLADLYLLAGAVLSAFGGKGRRKQRR